MTNVGVPLIAPLDVSKLNPAGTVGEIDHDVTGPPLAVGVTVVIAVPLVNVSELGEYVTEEGATSFTTIVMLTVALPPVFVPVIVYEVEEVIAVGVPEIAPVEPSITSPAGSDGDDVQLVTVPPVDVGVTVVIALPLVNVNEFGLYAIDVGATSSTSMVIVAVSLPPVLLAVTV